MRWMTLQQAARKLEVGEHVIKRLIDDGVVAVLGRDVTRPGRPLKLSADDVDTYGTRLAAGMYGRDIRTVLVVDPVNELEDVAAALKVSHLEVRTGRSILSAISMSPIHIEPAIMVIRTPLGADLNLLHALRRRVNMVVLGPVPMLRVDGDFEFAGEHRRAEVDDLRQIVRDVWDFVDRRAESAQGSK